MKHVLPRLLSPVAPAVTLGPAESIINFLAMFNAIPHLVAWVLVQLLYSPSCALPS